MTDRIRMPFRTFSDPHAKEAKHRPTGPILVNCNACRQHAANRNAGELAALGVMALRLWRLMPRNDAPEGELNDAFAGKRRFSV